jgi:hypothetical protein
MMYLNGGLAEIKDSRTANIKYLQISCLENRREKERKKLKRKGGGGKGNGRTNSRCGLPVAVVW